MERYNYKLDPSINRPITCCTKFGWDRSDQFHISSFYLIQIYRSGDNHKYVFLVRYLEYPSQINCREIFLFSDKYFPTIKDLIEEEMPVAFRTRSNI